MHFLYSVVFFFQAEDGIRDWSVTGVQTCALPICVSGCTTLALPCTVYWLSRNTNGFDTLGFPKLVHPLTLKYGSPACRSSDPFVPRSEERRVGKECRCQGWPYN